MADFISNGHKGGAYVADTTARVAPTDGWLAIQVLSDAVFSACAGNVSGLVGPTIPAGTPIFGKFTGFTLASGAVIAYLR